jgi:uncharacterized protein with HEPN domain
MRDDRERVLDILEAIAQIEKVVSRGRDVFYRDELVQVWVIYHLQIIGEAVRGISQEFRSTHTDMPWTEMIGMRNILVHHYFGIDKDAVWKVVEQDLPDLKEKFAGIIT